MAFRLVALAAASVIACSATAARRPSVIIGYMPMSAGRNALPLRANLKRYSHVMLAFANPDAAGRIVDGDRLTCMPGPDGATTTTRDLKETVAAVHRAGAKALLSIGGGVLAPCVGDWSVLLAVDRSKLVSAVVDLVDQIDADGVDVDIEGALLTRLNENGSYTSFVKNLADKLKLKGRLLTCATASYEGGMVPAAALPYFDYVSVMSYDRIGPTWGKAGDEHATYDQAVGDVDRWLGLGVPRDRLILGVPYYGYGFGSYRGTYRYRDLLATFGSDAAGTDLIGTACPACSYITYNGPATIASKALLARNRAGGIMVWSIVDDTADGLLGSTILRTLRTDRVIDAAPSARQTNPKAAIGRGRDGSVEWGPSMAR